MLSKLAVRRLTILADFMEALPKSANDHFYMGSWLEHRGADEHAFKEFIGAADPMTCGTVACALGWAATVPSFRKQGLRVMAGDGSNEEAIGVNFAEAEDFFDVDSDQSHTLFGFRDHIKTPKQWAKHCRRFIRENT